MSRLLPTHEDVSDIAQDVYVRVLRLDSLQRLEPNPRAYILQIAKNLVRDRYRRQQTRILEAALPAEPQAATTLPDPEDSLDWRQRMAEIKDSLHSLAPEVRRAFLLSRLRDMTYPAIAAEMGISTRTVRRYVAEALIHIQAALGDRP